MLRLLLERVSIGGVASVAAHRETPIGSATGSAFGSEEPSDSGREILWVERLNQTTICDRGSPRIFRKGEHFLFECAHSHLLGATPMPYYSPHTVSATRRSFEFAFRSSGKEASCSSPYDTVNRRYRGIPDLSVRNRLASSARRCPSIRL